jgi:hypothetical protein
MKRAINFELLAQLAGSLRTDSAQESGCSSLRISVERDIARLPDRQNASKDVYAGRAPVMEKSRNEVRSQVSDIGAIDAVGSAPETVGETPDCTSVEAFYALPEMPCSWWSALTFGKEDDTVSPADAETCLCLVRARLEATAGRQTSHDEVPTPIETMQGGDNVEYNVSLPITVGQLHEAIENLGTNAWSVFVGLWQEACGIEEPKKEEKHNQKPALAPCPAAEPDGKPDVPLPPLPAAAPVLEEGLHRELAGMPERVQAFLLHQQKPTPPWKHQESESERLERQALENLGAWTG